jgi:hypothetical protein
MPILKCYLMVRLVREAYVSCWAVPPRLPLEAVFRLTAERTASARLLPPMLRAAPSGSFPIAFAGG